MFYQKSMKFNTDLDCVSHVINKIEWAVNERKICIIIKSEKKTNRSGVRKYYLKHNIYRNVFPCKINFKNSQNHKK